MKKHLLWEKKMKNLKSKLFYNLLELIINIQKLSVDNIVSIKDCVLFILEKLIMLLS